MAKAPKEIRDEYSELAQYLKQIRLNKKLTRQKVAQSLRLPVETIAQLESHKTRDLPKSNIIGLYKRYGSLLKIDEDILTEKVAVLEKQTASNQFLARPKTAKKKRTYVASRGVVLSFVASIIAVLLSYGLWQLFILINAPDVEVFTPQENSVVTDAKVEVTGSVASDSTILLNGEPAPVNEDGSFAVTVYLQPGYNQISVTAVNNFSRQQTVERTIFFETD